MKILNALTFSVLLMCGTLTAQNRKNLPACIDHSDFYNQTLKVVINVKPVSGFEWHFPEAPSVVADRILTDLNDNDRLIKFKEPNGTPPNYVINVTMKETNEGTRRDEAWLDMWGPGDNGTQPGAVDSVKILSEKSGDAPYTSASEAVDHLAKNLLTWFATGWRGVPPCIQADGSIRQRSN